MMMLILSIFVICSILVFAFICKIRTEENEEEKGKKNNCFVGAVLWVVAFVLIAYLINLLIVGDV